MMRRGWVLLVSLALAGAALGAARDKAVAVTVLRGGTVIDGTGATLADAVVVVEGETIRAVGPLKKVKIPKGAREIDVSGKWILPGFIDCHAHITMAPEFLQEWTISGSFAVLKALHFLESYLRCGITSVRDAGGRVEALQALAGAAGMGWTGTSRVFACGQMLTATGGHGYGIEAGRGCDGPREWRKAVREMFADGFRHIKISPTYTREEVEAAVDEARILGMRVTAHGGGLSDTTPTSMTRLAVQAGVQCIEHLNEMEDDVLDLIAGKGVFLVPTLSIYRALYRRNEIARTLVEDRHWTQAMHESLFKKARARGITMGIGTDAVHSYGSLNPGIYFEELKYFVELGAAPMEAIICATRNGASILGQGKSLGTIEPGKTADLQVLDGDPLRSFDALGHPDIVIVGGRVHRFE